MSPRQLQLVSNPDADGSSSDRIPAPHLSSEKIIEALKASCGVMSDAARRLKIGRTTLYQRCRISPEIEAARVESRETLLDLGETQLVRLVKEMRARYFSY